ncbi:MAG: hypothetical protein V3U88_10700 [Methylococcales bacterium]
MSMSTTILSPTIRVTYFVLLLLIYCYSGNSSAIIHCDSAEYASLSSGCLSITEPDIKPVKIITNQFEPSSYWGYVGGGPFIYDDLTDFADQALADFLDVFKTASGRQVFDCYSSNDCSIIPGSRIFTLFVALGSDSFRRIHAFIFQYHLQQATPE